MTTTPDSRIRADWTLPADTAAPPPSLGVIDTSTTAGKIAVMQSHAADWRTVECKARHRPDKWGPLTQGTPFPGDEPAWNWNEYDYRIAPPTAPRSALKIAQDYNRNVPPTGGEADNSVRDLLKQIDNSIVVTIENYKFPHYSVDDPAKLTPGRYRLVRDEAP